jgi:hypothetical protein
MFRSYDHFQTYVCLNKVVWNLNITQKVVNIIICIQCRPVGFSPTSLLCHLVYTAYTNSLKQSSSWRSWPFFRQSRISLPFMEPECTLYINNSLHCSLSWASLITHTLILSFFKIILILFSYEYLLLKFCRPAQFSFIIYCFLSWCP